MTSRGELLMALFFLCAFWSYTGRIPSYRAGGECPRGALLWEGGGEEGTGVEQTSRNGWWGVKARRGGGEAVFAK